MPAGLRQQLRARVRNRLEMNVAAEVVLLSEQARYPHQLLHRVVRVADDAGAEKQALDIVAAVEVERELYDFLDSEARSLRIARAAVDAIETVVDAEVGEQDLQERDTAPVGGVAVADPHPFRRAHPPRTERVALGRPARRTRSVVLGRIRQHRQLSL